MIYDKYDGYYEMPDDTLISLTLLGNNEAFEALIIRYQKTVRAAAYSVTKNHYLAEDAMQISFIAAWTKLNTLKDFSKFGAWIYNIAKNNAKNLAMKHRGHIPLDFIENIQDAEAEKISANDYDPLQEAIENLSVKLKSVIRLHYFNGDSIDEIAAKLNLPAGTVKWRLHEGREKIRKELGYMEKQSKKLAESVLEMIEKVKEFRVRWYLRDDKDGFEPEYNDMIGAIEKMPESEEKYHAMANLMETGLWWLADKNNDDMVEKIRRAAEKGKNIEVLGEMWKRESDKYQGEERTKYILETLIPRMEQANMTDALGWEWFWLGYNYFKSGNKEAGIAAYKKVMEILPKHHVYYGNAVSALRLEAIDGNFNERDLCAGATGEELLIDGGNLYFYKQPGYSKGYYSHTIPAVLYHASRCDNKLYDVNLKAGESVKNHAGNATLTFVSDNAEVETSCGKFSGCELWITETPGFKSWVYYKTGIGIVYIMTYDTGGTKGKNCCSLKKYNISGGCGRFPLYEGNRWEYDTNFAPDAEVVYEIVSANDTGAIFASHNYAVKRYSPDVWEDMILKMRHEYWKYEDNNQVLNDVSSVMERAAEIADTKYKKTHTAVASGVMKRIFEGGSPEGRFKGHWNFFQYHDVISGGGKIKLIEDRAYAFEWKTTGNLGNMAYHLAVNYFMPIINDGTGCIWCENWKDGVSMTMQSEAWYEPVTYVTSEHIDNMEVAAGRFGDCIKVTFDIQSKKNAGWCNFLKGRKEYYYAKGIGLIKGVHYFEEDTVVPVYELTSYEGTGEGYMPVDDGLYRCYEAMGLTDGYEGKAEYTFCRDDDGNLKLLESNTGIKWR